ncbi:MAG: phage holin [Firmicutes bacterium]|nr:phage holin [Bacillota bacterium]
MKLNPNLKAKLSNYGFLMSLFSALFLIAQAIGRAFGYVISEEIYMTAVNAVLSCLVLLGFVTRPHLTDEPASDENEDE